MTPTNRNTPTKERLEEILKEFGKCQNPLMCSEGYISHTRELAMNSIIDLFKECVPIKFADWIVDDNKGADGWNDCREATLDNMEKLR